MIKVTTTPPPTVSLMCVDLGDIFELHAIREQFEAIRLDLAPNDFTRPDNLGTELKTHNKK